ncbi:MAG: hypothetical protein VW239_00345, partial [Candidatus Nanopelagicales bacterium]
LRGGQHEENGQACLLEAVSVVRGVAWTDDPATLNFPDLRNLNDAYDKYDAQRTAALVPLGEALIDLPDWSEERRSAWAKAITLRAAREILPIALRAVGLEENARACEEAETLEGARDSARIAATAVGGAWAAVWETEAVAAAKAGNATRVAMAVSRVATNASRVSARINADVLDLVARIMLEEAERSKTQKDQ